jgi:outer membrane lipoprotein-sorting protein
MFKNYFFALALPVGVMMLAVGGCGQQAPQEGESGPAQTENQNQEAQTDYSVSDLISSAESVGSYSCVLDITTPKGERFVQEIWRKGSQIRTEMTQEGQEVVFLMDREAKTSTAYMPSQNMAMKMDYSKAKKQTSRENSPKEQAQSLKDYETTIEGTETIEGRECVVVSYQDANTEGRMWLWRERGLPLKTEVTTANGTTVVRVEDLEVKQISDSMFEVPEGVEVLDASQMMQGQNMPSNIPSM